MDIMGRCDNGVMRQQSDAIRTCDIKYKLLDARIKWTVDGQSQYHVGEGQGIGAFIFMRYAKMR